MPDVPEVTTCNLFDDQHLEKHVLLIQPWVNGVKSKRSVYVQLHWMYARSAGLGYPYYHVSHFTTATSTTTIVSFYFWLTASGKNLEHAQNENPIECIHAQLMRQSIEWSRGLNTTMGNPIKSDFSRTKVFTCILKIQ